MLDVVISNLILDKSVNGKLTVQLLGTIVSDLGLPVKYRIVEKNGLTLFRMNDFIETPTELSIEMDLNREYLEKSNLTLVLIAEDNSGEISSDEMTIDGFEIISVNRLTTDTYDWQIRNLSIVPIYTMIQILDNTGRVVLNSNEYRKDKSLSISTYKTKLTNYDSLPIGKYRYRLRFYSKDESWTRFYPNETGFEFIKKENNVPLVRIKDTKVNYEGNYFNFYSKVLISDFDLDNITYNITDNLNNNLSELDGFTYSPQIERLEAKYPAIPFGKTHLTITANVKDEFYGIASASQTIPLFQISELHRERDYFQWKYRNYSNKLLSMQVEAIDFDEKIVKLGDTVRLRSSFDFETIKGKTKFDLERDYYRFRLKIVCEEEGWTQYYPSEYGIQWTRRDHENPVIELLNENFIYRDLDDIKYLKTKFNVTDKEDDLIMYIIKDESDTIIRQSTSYIETPAKFNLTLPYPTINSTESNITISVFDDNGGTASVTFLARAYVVNYLKNLYSNVLQWSIDNYSREPLNYQLIIEKIEINDLNEEVSTVVFTKDYVQPMTLRPNIETLRINPKLKEGNYKCYLKLTSKTVQIYPESKHNFTVEKNNSPECYIYNNELTYNDEEDILHLSVEGEIKDIDNDYVTYNLIDQYKNTLSKSESFIPTPVSVKGSYRYDTKNINNSRLYISLNAIDEGEYENTVTEFVNLFEIKNLYKNNLDFYWSVRNLCNLNLEMQIEILDKNKDLFARGEVQKIDNITSFVEYKNTFQNINFREGNYYYRIKIFSRLENITTFYPNSVGTLFKITKKHPPIIKNVESDVDRLLENWHSINIKADINDSNKPERVYLRIIKK